jgi:hypothetical protein
VVSVASGTIAVPEVYAGLVRAGRA